MALPNYEPFRQFEALSREMQRLAAENPVRAADAGGVHASDWVPAVDVAEEENRFVIYADVPGVEATDIDIHMENGVLTVKGERRVKTEENTERFSRSERVKGTFLRRFTLPDTADEDHIDAKTRNGVLELVIPKREKAQPKKIAVQG